MSDKWDLIVKMSDKLCWTDIMSDKCNLIDKMSDKLCLTDIMSDKLWAADIVFS